MQAAAERCRLARQEGEVALRRHAGGGVSWSLESAGGSHLVVASCPLFSDGTSVHSVGSCWLVGR